jgi:hypothetical protein
MTAFWKWLIGGVGTIVLGLAALWINNAFGPKRDQDRYPGPPIEFSNDGNFVLNHFLSWVLHQGKDGITYTQRINVKTAVWDKVEGTPGPQYKNADGLNCRRVPMELTKQGELVEAKSLIYCVIDGAWLMQDEKIDTMPTRKRL